MNNPPLVSIIMISFNAMKFIGVTRKGIDSLLSQTYPKKEIIFVDDNSTDGSFSIIQDFCKEKNIKLITSKRRRGVACARNSGLEISQGEIIAFIDNDAIAEKDWIEKMVLRFQKDEKIGAIAPMVVFLNNPETINSIGSTIDKLAFGTGVGMSQSVKQFIPPEEILYPTGNGMTFPKSIFDKIGPFDEEMRKWGYEDTDIGIRIRNIGLKIVTEPNAKIHHLYSLERKSINTHIWNQINRIRFILKHYNSNDLLKWFPLEIIGWFQNNWKLKISYPLFWIGNLPTISATIKYRKKNIIKNNYFERFKNFF